MIADSTIQVRMPQNKKNKVNSILKKEGQSFSSAINLFFSYIIEEGKLPVKLDYNPNAETASVIREGRKGVNIEEFKNADDMFKSLG